MNKIKIDHEFKLWTMRLVGVLSFIYSIYLSDIAEVHIKLPFLDFPIFVGEIVLGIIFILFLIYIKRNPVRVKKSHYLIALFYIFVLIKAFYGYSARGPLAFRHAALFYYTLYGIVCYHLWDFDFFKKPWRRWILMAGFMILLYFRLTWYNFNLDYFIFASILLLSYKRNPVTYAIIGVFFVMFSFRFIDVGRGVLLSNFLSIFFVFIAVFLYFWRTKTIYKIGTLFFLLLIAAIAIWRMADKNDLRSLVCLGDYVEKYKKLNQLIDQQKDFEFEPVEVRAFELNPRAQVQHRLPFREVDYYRRALYNSPERFAEFFPEEAGRYMAEAEMIEEEAVAAKTEILPGGNRDKDRDKGGKTERRKPKSELDLIIARNVSDFRHIAIAQQNLFWRFMMWQDIAEETLKSGLPFGVDFGKPFRSRRVEISYNFWGGCRGEAVGWLEPHNGYLHIIYRSGIVGVFFVIFIWGLFFRVARDFMRLGSLKGVLLSAAVLFWMFLSNTEEVLELPYFAIPFWSLFGITCRYCHNLLRPKKSAV